MENKEEFEKLARQEVMKSFEKDLEEMINRDKIKEAHALAIQIKNYFLKFRSEFNKMEELHSFYYKILVKARFIALPLISDSETLNIFKNNFLQIFDLKDYDIFFKIKYKLINILIYEDRDIFKQKLRDSLQENNQQITKKTSIKTVGAWIKKYNKDLGIGVINNIEKSKFYSLLAKNTDLSEMEVFKLKTLFSLYEKLKHSTFTPEGFEEDVIVVVKGKTYYYHDGEVDVIEKETTKGKKLTGPPKTTAEKNIEQFEKEGEEHKSAIEQLAIKEEIEKENKLEELRFMATKFPENSLERRAIKEEIKHVESNR